MEGATKQNGKCANQRLSQARGSPQQTAPKLCQNCAKTPSVHSRCVITDVLIHALLVRLPIQLD